MHRVPHIAPRFVFGAFLSLVHGVCSAAVQNQDVEFFEKKIRPVLAGECYECHSAEAQKSKGGLSLDTREGLLRGGESGAALVPGKASESLILSALRHESLEMPPKKKLSKEVVQDFLQWIEGGAPDPRTGESVAQGPVSMNIEKGREHWAFQAPKKGSVPKVRDTGWPRQVIDHYVLASLEAGNLKPVGPATKRELVRRATFDLTGLPPTPAEVFAFEADTTPTAFEKVVERLLASPHYGERWGRHWLDVARYAEDQAHTFGVKANDSGFRYRDWVIDALNADMPYDAFVRRQIAGDHMEGTPDRAGEQLAALGFFGLGAVYYKNSDAAKAAADELDDRVDTLTRGFLGLTVSCARCHDHKFDPIPTQDYYSLAGVFQSSKLFNAPLASSEVVKTFDAAQTRIKGGETAVKKFLAEYKKGAAETGMREAARYLQAVWKRNEGGRLKTPRSLAELCMEDGLSEPLLKRWMEAADSKNRAKFPELIPWFDLKPAADSVAGLPAEVVSTALAVQTAFVQALNERDGVSSGAVASAQGEAARYVSPIITPAHRSVDLDLDITGARQLYLVVTDGGDGINSDHAVWCEPRLVGATGEVSLTELEWKSARAGYGQVKRNANFSGSPLELSGKKYATGLGTHAPAEVVYNLPQDGGFTRFKAVLGLNAGASGSVQFRVYFGPPSDLEKLPVKAVPLNKQTEMLLQAMAGENGALSPSDAEVEKLLPEEARGKLSELKGGVEQAKKEAPGMYPVAHVITDGNPADMKVFIRGNPARQGELAPRRFLRVLSPVEPVKFTKGSGRLELAEAIASPANPLTARVMVNRIWQHHFGRGLVNTPSNFGVLGDRPTHPELLDYLAGRLVEQGWSLKAIHRELMLSSVYQLSSAGSAENERVDADNLLLWRMNRSRLDVESWRDALLSVSGLMDPAMGGRSTNLAQAENRRRTVYAKVSRHELDGLLRLFDFPDANITSDKRTETTVPQQQLFVLNSPFMLSQARAFAARLQNDKTLADDSARLRHAFLLAYGREALDSEARLLLGFLSGTDAEETKAVNKLTRWERVAQTLLGSNEFMYVD